MSDVIAISEFKFKINDRFFFALTLSLIDWKQIIYELPRLFNKQVLIWWMKISFEELSLSIATIALNVKFHFYLYLHFKFFKVKLICKLVWKRISYKKQLLWKLETLNKTQLHSRNLGLIDEVKLTFINKSSFIL